MSGPVDEADTEPVAATAPSPTQVLEITPSRVADVAGTRVLRALPRRARRTIGAWCFLDHFQPTGPSDPPSMIGPHPHVGLQTVTWLLDGETLHSDSLGNEQLIRPGQLNLMSAGHGVAHAEDGRRSGRAGHGVQLWVAQPEATRHGAAAFEHQAELPRVALGSGEATVLVGELAGARSPRAPTARSSARISRSTARPSSRWSPRSNTGSSSSRVRSRSRAPASSRITSCTSATVATSWCCAPTRRAACCCSVARPSARS